MHAHLFLYLFIDIFSSDTNGNIGLKRHKPEHTNNDRPK